MFFSPTPFMSGSIPLLANVGHFELAGGWGNDTVVTGVGFQPKVILSWSVGRSDTGDAIGGANAQITVGAANSPTSRCYVCSYDQDGAGTSNASYAAGVTSLLDWLLASSLEGAVDLKTLDSDGFTLLTEDPTTATKRIGYLALAGDAIVNVATGYFTTPAGVGYVNVTSVGFKPDAVLCLGAPRVSLDVLDSTAGVIQFGGASSNASGDQFSVGSISVDAMSASNNYGWGTTGYVMRNGGGGWRAKLDEFHDLGFRLYFDSSGGSGYPVPFIALKGPQFKCGVFDTRTDTNNFSVTNVGFTPRAVIFVSACLNTESGGANTWSNDGTISIGVASSPTRRGAMAWHTNFNSDPMQVATAQRIAADPQVYIDISDSDTVDGLMDLVSFDGGGFTVKMDDADPETKKVFYIAIGDKTA